MASDLDMTLDMSDGGRDLTLEDEGGMDASMPDQGDLSGDMVPDMCPCEQGCDEEGECIPECDENRPCTTDSYCSLEGSCEACLEVSGAIDLGCNEDTPICQGGECVACEQGTPFYNSDKDTCQVCLENSGSDGTLDDGCTNAAPVCGEEGECLSCEDATNGSAPYYDSEQDACVACIDSSQCDNETFPTCDDQNTCIECMDNAPGTVNQDCVDTSNGARTQCVNSQCVQCQDSTHCVGQGAGGEDLVCNTNDNTCDAMAVVRSKDVGQACLFDEECELGAACIQMTFGSGTMQTPIGGFCMLEKSGSCVKPWGFTRMSESQANSTPREFCVHNENKVSPQAVYNTIPTPLSCTMDDECGLGGVCRIVLDNVQQCTYACAVSGECPTDCVSNYCY